jgi:hypothetical protein
MKIVESADGFVHVVTKSRSAGLLPDPHTSIIPANSAAVKSLGIVIHWRTREPSTLKKLHQAVIAMVEANSLITLVEIVNLAKCPPSALRKVGIEGAGLYAVAKDWQNHDVPFPFPSEVVEHAKGFK